MEGGVTLPGGVLCRENGEGDGDLGAEMCCFEGCSWWRETGKQRTEMAPRPQETLELMCVAEAWGCEGLVGRKGQCLSVVLKSWKDGRELGWGVGEERERKGPMPERALLPDLR